MTVQELIEELEKIEDKGQKIYARDWASDNGEVNVCEVYQIVNHEEKLVIL